MKHWTLWLLIVVCVLGLVGCATPQQDDPEPSEGPTALIPMVMVNGTLYLDTGYDSTEARCGNTDGEITSTVSGSEQPTENDQSNFGDGYGYQYGMQEGTIEVYLDDAWRIFATEEVREDLQFPTEES